MATPLSSPSPLVDGGAPAAVPRGRSWSGHLRVFAIAWIATTVAGFLLLSLVLYTRVGRSWVCDAINRLGSDALNGDIHVDEVLSIEGSKVRARGVKLIAPDGVPAIDAHRAEVHVDLWALMQGRFAWHSAHVRGGIVRVSEDAQGRVNMEETFRAAHPSGKKEPDTAQMGDMLDFRAMATEGMTLEFGGQLPHLRLERLNGIMRIRADRKGHAELRFDGYRGHFVEGLPSGKLVFEQVKGSVTPSNDQLLHFEGKGKSEGEPVSFSLDIVQEPSTKVDIYARFPRLSAESLSTAGFGLYTKFTKALRVHVSHGGD